MRDTRDSRAGGAIHLEAVHLVETYLRLNGFFTFGSPNGGDGRSRSSVDLIGLRLPFSTGDVLTPDPELGLSFDAIEVVSAILDADGSIVDTEVRDPGSLEWALLSLGCCQGDPQTMAMTLVRSGRAVSFLRETRLRARIFVFGDAPAPTRYDTISFEHVSRYVQVHGPVQERLGGALVPNSLQLEEVRDA